MRQQSYNTFVEVLNVLRVRKMEQTYMRRLLSKVCNNGASSQLKSTTYLPDQRISDKT